MRPHSTLDHFKSKKVQFHVGLWGKMSLGMEIYINLNKAYINHKEKNCEGNICDGECCNFPKCVPATSTCDGVNDCGDRSDEGDFCQKNDGNVFLRFSLNSIELEFYVNKFQDDQK